MPLYVLLTKITSQGVRTIRDNPQRIKEVNREVEALGARVLAQYATLGRFDFVNIVEAKDAETIAKISVNLGARGTVQIETLAAIDVHPWRTSSGACLEALPRGEASFERMPPLHARLPDAPAEIHLAVVAERAEVHETHGQVLHLDAELLHLFDEARDRLPQLRQSTALLGEFRGLPEVAVPLSLPLDQVEIRLQLLEPE